MSTERAKNLIKCLFKWCVQWAVTWGPGLPADYLRHPINHIERSETIFLQKGSSVDGIHYKDVYPKRQGLSKDLLDDSIVPLLNCDAGGHCIHALFTLRFGQPK